MAITFYTMLSLLRMVWYPWGMWDMENYLGDIRENTKTGRRWPEGRRGGEGKASEDATLLRVLKHEKRGIEGE